MAAFDDDKFSMPADKYLAKHHILTYLQDSVLQLLQCREENPKIVPAQFFCEYFCSLRDGQHLMFREYNFIKSTPHNRISFIVLFWKCFRHIGKKGDLLSMQEYQALLALLCPDLPFQLVQNVARIVLIDDAWDCLISFSDFMYAFQAQFYFEEFLEAASRVYQGLVQTLNSAPDPVIVPTSVETNVHQYTHHPVDGVDAVQFFRAIYPTLSRADYSTPPLTSLKEILFGVSRISFYEFLMAIAKSESINKYIGRLPAKTALLDSEEDTAVPLASLEVGRQVLRTPRINKPKLRKTQAHSGLRTSQKVTGQTRPSKLSSGSYLTSDLVSMESIATKTQRSHRKQTGVSSDTESESANSEDSSDTN